MQYIHRLFFLGLVLGICAASGAANASVNLVFLSNGLGAPNDYPSSQLPDEFHEWCGGICFPTVRLVLEDAKTEVPKGSLFAWGKNVTPDPALITEDSTFCFDEFIIWQLEAGEIYTESTRGPCGTYLDRDLVPPALSQDPATKVVAGGGQGEVIGGTGPYQKWSGTYATRVFVEDLSTLQFSYYDFLFATISGGVATE